MCAQGPRGSISSLGSFEYITVNDVVDFDDYVSQHCEARQKRTGLKFKWLDMYGIHPKHKDPPEKRSKINVDVQQAQWEDHITDLRRPKVVFTQWFHNAGSKEMENKFSRQVKLDIPAELSNSGNNKTEVMDLTNIDEKQSRNTETFLSESSIIVPSKKSVKVDIIMMEREVEIPWKCDVIISGQIHVEFNEKHNKIGYKDANGQLLPKSKTWWYSPSHLEDRLNFFAHDEYNLRYEAKGNFYSYCGSTPQIKIQELDLQDADANGEGVPVPLPKPINLQRMFK
ncbi:unnamed protein product [Meganyctiphanes norvegica]|uniref:Uncharacterized protein n=1 Tax=Meganyctiphanes norvegica TaxID=48144 RepID=A0AAV2Q7X0_MEGNR